MTWASLKRCEASIHFYDRPSQSQFTEGPFLRSTYPRHLRGGHQLLQRLHVSCEGAAAFAGER